MLTRRHIRIKVMQSLYAFYQSDYQDLEKQEKFLRYSILQMKDLTALMLHLMVAVRNHAQNYLEKSQQKLLATEQDKNPSRSFIDNKVIAMIAKHPELQQFLKNQKLNHWEKDDEYVAILFKNLRAEPFYEEYLSIKKPSFKEDVDFVSEFYKQVIAPNDKLYEYLEDQRLTWLDDFPLVNTSLVKILDKVQPNKGHRIFNPEVFKNEDDKEYSVQLLRKVILNDDSLTQAIDGKTPNWDQDRIADLDMIILKLGIAEFLYFPSIPLRVTINEYLEIAKEYSTPKSSVFINGILDKLAKEYEEEGKLNKIGRGLT